MGKKNHHLKKEKKILEESGETPGADFDIGAFVEEQQLEMDEDVAKLFATDAPAPKKPKTKPKLTAAQLKKKKEAEKKSGSESESDVALDEETLDSEDEREMMAFVESLQVPTPIQGMQEKVYANHKEAILSRLEDIRLDPSFPWVEILADTTADPCPLEKEEVHDDLKRELCFYQQALATALEGRRQIKAAGIPFSRPDDYFAEMIKSDEHMAKVRQRLLDETQALKASELARKQREAKKFGKKLQVEKQLERERNKKEELEKVKMARKKQDSTQNDDDDFGVSLDREDQAAANRKSFGKKGGPSNKRARKDQKFGFGGPKRNNKSNTAASTDDMGSFNLKKMKNSGVWAGKKVTSHGGKKSGARRH